MVEDFQFCMFFVNWTFLSELRMSWNLLTSKMGKMGRICGRMHSAGVTLGWLGVRRIMVQNIRIGTRTMRKHHPWTGVVIIVYWGPIDGGWVMKSPHWLSLRWIRATTKSYFCVTVVRRVRICCISQLGFFVSCCGHSLRISSSSRRVGTYLQQIETTS